LDKFFSSIRFATCRENGELGLPCRIKILELLEFRLMGWKNNLSVFYLKNKIYVTVQFGIGRPISNLPKRQANLKSAGRFQIGLNSKLDSDIYF
jgi:hypothetical protein